MSPNDRTVWPAALAAQVRALYESGLHTTVQICARIGWVKNKNAVIGKAHRAGWTKTTPEKTSRPKRVHRRKVWKPPHKVEQPVEAPKSLDFLGLTLDELTLNQCRYPHGDSAPYLFCAQPVQDGSSYCVEHHAVCWQRATGATRRFTSAQKF